MSYIINADITRGTINQLAKGNAPKLVTGTAPRWIHNLIGDCQDSMNRVIKKVEEENDLSIERFISAMLTVNRQKYPLQIEVNENTHEALKLEPKKYDLESEDFDEKWNEDWILELIRTCHDAVISETTYKKSEFDEEDEDVPETEVDDETKEIETEEDEKEEDDSKEEK